MRRKRETARERFKRQRAEWIAHNPNPWHEWPHVADAMRGRITEAMQKHPPIASTWRKSKGERARQLSVDDLAVALWAITSTQGKGTNYGQLDHAFKTCTANGVGCHRNEAAKLFEALQSLGLIRQVGNYSVGRRGNVFEVVRLPTDETWP